MAGFLDGLVKGLTSTGILDANDPDVKLAAAQTNLKDLQNKITNIYAEVGEQVMSNAEQATAYPEQAKRLELLRLEIEAAQRTLSTLQAGKAQQEAKQPAKRAAREAAEAAFTCPNCGMVNKEGTKFCQECGTKLSGQTKAFCTACGAELPPGTRFCGECGARQAE